LRQKKIEADTLQSYLKDENVLVVDARSPDQYQNGHIPTSVNIPANLISTDFRLTPHDFNRKYHMTKPDKSSSTKLVVHGPIAAAEVLRNLGYTGVVHYTGDLSYWTTHSVSFDELKAAVNGKDILVVDIRLPVELQMFGKIPNSQNIPFTDIPTIFSRSNEEFERKVGFRKPSLSTPLLVIGHNDSRNSANHVATIMTSLGYTDVAYYPGGFRLWKEREPVAFPKTIVVSYDEVVEATTNPDIILLDVRSAAELREKGSLPGSVNVPLNEIHRAFLLPSAEFEKQYGFAKPRPPGSNVIITGGRSSRRGEEAIRRLRALRYTALKHYEGSFGDWLQKGGRVIKETNPAQS